MNVYVVLNGELEVTRVKKSKVKNSNAIQVKKMLGPIQEQSQNKVFNPTHKNYQRSLVKIALYC